MAKANMMRIKMKRPSYSTAPPKVLKNKKADRVGIKTGLCPDAIQRRNRWSAKPKAVGLYKRLHDSAHGALKSLRLVETRSDNKLYFVAATALGTFGVVVLLRKKAQISQAKKLKLERFQKRGYIAFLYKSYL